MILEVLGLKSDDDEGGSNDAAIPLKQQLIMKKRGG